MDIGGGNKPQIKVKEWLLRARKIDKEIALLQKTQLLIYRNNQWEYSCAKHFVPADTKEN